MSIVWNGYDVGLNPALVAAGERVLGPLGGVWVATRGLASWTAQAALYAKYQAGGALAAPPGESAHSFGDAFDVALRTLSGALSWDVGPAGAPIPAWADLWAAIEASPDLHSGHDFPPGDCDDDHIELYAWAHPVAGAPSIENQLKASGQWGQPPAGATT